jgi:hypothetical protein
MKFAKQCLALISNQSLLATDIKSNSATNNLRNFEFMYPALDREYPPTLSNLENLEQLEITLGRFYLGRRRRSVELGLCFREPRDGPLFSTTGVIYGIPEGS